MIRPWIEDFSAFDHFAQPLGFLEIADRLLRSGCDVYYLDALREPDPQPSDEKRIESGMQVKLLSGYDCVTIKKPIVFNFVPRYYKRFGVSRESLLLRMSSLPIPDVVLITSGMTYWFEGIRGVMDLLSSLYPEASVAIGGVYTSINPDHARRTFPTATIFSGFPGETFTDWLSRKTTMNVFAQADDPQACPAWKLVPELHYGVLATSRGCRNSCAYCIAGKLNPGWSPRPLSQIRNEIEALVRRHNIRNIALYDDDLGCQTPEGIEHFEAFLKMLVEIDLPVRWHLPNALGIDSISPAIASLMMKSGFEQPRLSLHHLDRRLGENGFDDLALAAFQTASVCLEGAGYNPTDLSTYIVAGIPDQKLDWLRKAAGQLLERGIKPYLAQFSPIPGTPLGDRRLEQLGYLSSGELLLSNKILSVYHHPGWSGDSFQAFAAELKSARD